MILGNQWSDYAENFDSLEEYSHFLPDLYDLLGDIEDKEILDLGCSNGVMCRLLAGAGANLTGVDISSHAVDIARLMTGQKEVNAVYEVADARDLSMFEDFRFHQVLAINTLCSFGTDRNVMHTVAGEIDRILKPAGALVAVLPHPAFEHRQKCPTRKRTFPTGYSYFDGGTENTLDLAVGKNRSQFSNVHWSLEDYSEFFRDRFLISDIREPEPDENFDKLHPGMFAEEPRYPVFLLLKWIKPPAWSGQ